MPLTQFLTFPVAFRSELDGAPFRLTSFFVLIYVVMPPLAPDAPVGQLAKYVLAIALMLCFALLAVTRLRINPSPLFPLAALLLSVAGGISLAHSIFIAPGTNTYSSALIPMIVAAIPLLIATRTIRTDGATATKYVFRIFAVAALCHVLWQVGAGLVGWTEGGVYYGGVTVPYASASLVIVFFMILCGLFRRNLLLVLSVALVGVSELLRPSSTLAFLTMFAAAIILLHRLRFRRFWRLACVVVAAGVIVGNLAVLESKEVADAFYSIEPSVKGDVGGESNNGFRLAVLSAARDEIAQHSLLVGEAFTGEVMVDPLLYVRWETTRHDIHSDFVIMIVQGGLIGYGLFASLFVGMALLCAKGARLAHAARDGSSETLFDALQGMNVAFMLCISGNPMLADVQNSAPYLILLPLAIFLARAQPGFSRLRGGMPSVTAAVECRFLRRPGGHRSWHRSRPGDSPDAGDRGTRRARIAGAEHERLIRRVSTSGDLVPGRRGLTGTHLLRDRRLLRDILRGAHLVISVQRLVRRSR
jgi:hypothetical protein